MDYRLILFGALLVTVAVVAIWRLKHTGRQLPPRLRPGQRLPDFAAVDEDGQPVNSGELIGRAAVLLFIRGNWCPFCNRQVANLTDYYKRIVDLDARLILITSKPLETTRRVAEYFAVDFEFWLDSELRIATELGLLHVAGVPKKHRDEYGADTIWPTAVVVDKSGIIRFSEQSRFIADRPNPETLLRELQAVQN